MEFNIGAYKDKILCDIVPMDVCELLLRSPWKFDRNTKHDGHTNVYFIEKDGVSYTLTSLQEDGGVVHEGPSVMVVKEEFLKYLEEENIGYAIVGKPISNAATTSKEEIPKEVLAFLHKYEDIGLKDLPSSLPPIRDVSHHIYLILGASFPNKPTYKMTPKKNEEIRN